MLQYCANTILIYVYWHKSVVVHILCIHLCFEKCWADDPYSLGKLKWKKMGSLFLWLADLGSLATSSCRGTFVIRHQPIKFGQQQITESFIYCECKASKQKGYFGKEILKIHLDFKKQPGNKKRSKTDTQYRKYFGVHCRFSSSLVGGS